MKEQGIINVSVAKTKIFRAKIVAGVDSTGVDMSYITPFENELGAVTISKVAVGIFDLVSPLFLIDKTFVLYTPQASISGTIKAEVSVFNGIVSIATYNSTSGVLEDFYPEDLFGFIEIIIYP